MGSPLNPANPGFGRPNTSAEDEQIKNEQALWQNYAALMRQGWGQYTFTPAPILDPKVIIPSQVAQQQAQAAHMAELAELEAQTRLLAARTAFLNAMAEHKEAENRLNAALKVAQPSPSGKSPSATTKSKAGRTRA
jgi:hypothetical protein